MLAEPSLVGAKESYFIKLTGKTEADVFLKRSSSPTIYKAHKGRVNMTRTYSGANKALWMSKTLCY